MTAIVAGDVVRVPSGREALVLHFVGANASCEYLDDHDAVTLNPSLLRFLRKSTAAEQLRNRGKRRKA
jgi:hypothetical protein